jgi:hypothetical protein
MVQPILDNHCIKCHDASHKSLNLQANPVFDNGGKKTFNSSYTNLTKTQKKYVDWITQESKAAPITKFPAPGSGTSPLADRLIKGHNNEKMTPEEREILFCWMDMMVPHGGTYYEGMAAADSTKYVTYLKDRRNKHIEWEQTNIKAFVEAGQWKNDLYVGASAVDEHRYAHGSAIKSDAATEFSVIRSAGKLTVQCPGAGMISLLDMKGRTLKNLAVTDAVKNGTTPAVIPFAMPAGVYVVRFNGNNVVRQRVVTSLSAR